MLKTIVEGQLWVAEDDLFMPGGVHFPIRMTVIKLSGGGLWLHSPVPIDDALAANLKALGPVEHIVAPNALHHLYLADCAKRYPDACVYGPKALVDKRPEVAFDAFLDEDNAWLWGAEVDQRFIQGIPWMQETVFFHKPSATLVVTDLVFNIHKSPRLMSKLVLIFMAGAWKKLAQSRLVRFSTKDKQAAGASAARIFEWDFKRLIMAHGDIVEHNARTGLKEALSWMLSHNPTMLPGGAQAA